MIDLISKTKNITNKTRSNNAGWKKFRKLYILILSLANKITIWKEWTIIISDNNIKWIQWSPEPSSKKRNNAAITPIQSRVHKNAQIIPKEYIFFREYCCFLRKLERECNRKLRKIFVYPIKKIFFEFCEIHAIYKIY